MATSPSHQQGRPGNRHPARGHPIHEPPAVAGRTGRKLAKGEENTSTPRFLLPCPHRQLLTCPPPGLGTHLGTFRQPTDSAERWSTAAGCISSTERHEARRSQPAALARGPPVDPGSRVLPVSRRRPDRFRSDRIAVLMQGWDGECDLARDCDQALCAPRPMSSADSSPPSTCSSTTTDEQARDASNTLRRDVSKVRSISPRRDRRYHGLHPELARNLADQVNGSLARRSTSRLGQPVSVGDSRASSPRAAHSRARARNQSADELTDHIWALAKELRLQGCLIGAELLRRSARHHLISSISTEDPYSLDT